MSSKETQKIKAHMELSDKLTEQFKQFRGKILSDGNFGDNDEDNEEYSAETLSHNLLGNAFNLPESYKKNEKEIFCIKSIRFFIIFS